MNKDFENIDFNKLKDWFNSLPNERKKWLYQATNITYNSCGIEGNSLTKNETFNLIVKHTYLEENQD